MTFIRKAALVVVASMTLAACAGRGPEMETVDYVDLERFMGDWYVIANIPTCLLYTSPSPRDNQPHLVCRLLLE